MTVAPPRSRAERLRDARKLIPGRLLMRRGQWLPDV